MLLLYLFRSIDDNRLTRWDWVFEKAGVIRLLLPVAGGIILAGLLSQNRRAVNRPSIWLFAVSFAISSFFWREPELIVDASRYFTQAKHLELYGAGYFFREWGREIPAWTDLPLVPFLHGLIFTFFGETRIVIQVFTTTLFSFTVVLAYLMGKEMRDKETGIYAGLFLLSIPYIYTQTPLMLADVPAAFFFTLSVYTFTAALKKGGHRLLFAALALFAALLSKYSLWPMLSTLCVVLAVHPFSPDAGAANRKAACFQGISRTVIVLLITASLTGVVLLFKSNVAWEQLRFLLDYQGPGLKRWGENCLSTFLFQTHPFFTVAALVSLFAAAKQRDARILITVWPLLVLMLLQVKRMRYTLPAFPLLAVAAAYGLCMLREKETRRFVALCAACCSVMLALFAYRPLVREMSCVNLKHAGEYLDSLPSKDAEVHILPYTGPALNPSTAVPLLDLFTKKNIRYAYHPEEQPPPPDKDVSPLRFTWEYKNPRYYGYDPERLPDRAIVVISGEPGKELPETLKEKTKDLHSSRSFSVSDEMFMHQTFVTVYY